MDAKIKKEIEVAAAALVHDHKLLVTQRGTGTFKDFWELPGGKRETGESFAEAAVRELYEELEIDIVIEDKIAEITYEYPEFKLRMQVLKAAFKDPKQKPRLTVHESLRWVSGEELDELRWLPADYQLLPNLRALLA